MDGPPTEEETELLALIRGVIATRDAAKPSSAAAPPSREIPTASTSESVLSNEPALNTNRKHIRSSTSTGSATKIKRKRQRTASSTHQADGVSSLSAVSASRACASRIPALAASVAHGSPAPATLVANAAPARAPTVMPTKSKSAQQSQLACWLSMQLLTTCATMAQVQRGANCHLEIEI